MKHKSLIAFFALGLTLVLAGCSSSNGASSITAPKNVSFAKQSHDGGNHVWIETGSRNGVIDKEDLVRTIYVMKDNHTKAYQVFDNNITLGKLSSMNDRDTIKLAQEQDKKYVSTGAIQEIKNYLNDKDQVGQEDDFNDGAKNVVDGSFILSFTSPETISGEDGDYMEYKQIYNIFPTIKATSNSVDSLDEEDNYNPTIVNETTFKILEESVKTDYIHDKKLGNALINHIKNAKYQEPSNQTLKIKNTTDNSGNKITYQSFEYTAIALFKNSDHKAHDTLYKISSKNKNDVLKLIKLSTGYYSHQSLKELKNTANTDPKFAQQLPEVMHRRSERNNLFNKVYGDKYSELTNNIYGYYPWKKKMILYSPTSQKIYKSKYIGYKLYSAQGGCILTKAQNDKQKAVLSK